MLKFPHLVLNPKNVNLGGYNKVDPVKFLIFMRGSLFVNLEVLKASYLVIK